MKVFKDLLFLIGLVLITLVINSMQVSFAIFVLGCFLQFLGYLSGMYIQKNGEADQEYTVYEKYVLLTYFVFNLFFMFKGFQLII